LHSAPAGASSLPTRRAASPGADRAGAASPSTIDQGEETAMFRRIAFVFAAVAGFSAGARAEVKKEWVEYADGATRLKAYVLHDDAVQGKRPAIFMIHAREGMSPRTLEIADNWAKLGYVVFATDIFGYGQGVLPKTVPEMEAQTSIYSKDRALMRARTQAGFDTLLKDPRVDAGKIAVIGYCFGGDVGTEFTSTGAPVAANVTIHGSFRDREPGWAKSVKGRFVILHGAEDKGYPLTKVAKVVDELRAQKKDFMLEVYSGTGHGFSTPKGKDEERANARSIQTAAEQMKELFGL
jgi:dienelactone hydrolase